MPRWLRNLLIVLIIAFVGAAIAAPIGPVPGIRIGGTSAAAPETWADANLPEEVRLAAYDGPIPYVVTIWIVESDDRLYVIGAPESTWVEKASRSPDVRLRIGDSVYDMRASRMPPGREDIFQAYIDRYRDGYPDIVGNFPPLAEFAQGGALFELIPR
jgi:hypothetical protein